MSNAWSTTLVDAPFREDGALPDFGQPDAELQAAEHAGIVVPLTETAVCGAFGKDARSFLHGQLSQGVDDLSEAEWRLGGYCSPKGRLLALLRFFAEDSDHVLALTHGSVLDSALRRLQMFVLRAQVALEDLSDRTAAIGLAGPVAGETLAEIAGTPPAEPGGVTEAGDLRVLRLPDDGNVPRFTLLAPVPELVNIWGMLSRALTPAGTDAWDLLAVRTGEPQITEATAELFVPQMVNLELIGGVNFSKGCYPGQEIVARMHYRGRAKRRMFRIVLDTAHPPEPGTAVRTDQGQEAGAVVRAAPNRQGQVEALAVLPLDRVAEETLYVAELPLRLETLPYPIPTGE